MKPPRAFDPEHERELAAELAAGRPPLCPVCSVPLDAWPVDPRGDVSYVRERVLLVCTTCRRSVVLDRPRG